MFVLGLHTSFRASLDQARQESACSPHAAYAHASPLCYMQVAQPVQPHALHAANASPTLGLCSACGAQGTCCMQCPVGQALHGGSDVCRWPEDWSGLAPDPSCGTIPAKHPMQHMSHAQQADWALEWGWCMLHIACGAGSAMCTAWDIPLDQPWVLTLEHRPAQWPTPSPWSQMSLLPLF